MSQVPVGIIADPNDEEDGPDLLKSYDCGAGVDSDDEGELRTVN